MTRSLTLFCLVLNLAFCNLSCSTSTYLKSGIIYHHKYFINIEPSTSLPMPDSLGGKIWFKDSCVIYEVKVLNIVTNHSDMGTQKTESFDTYKYTYLDLRTAICQDYYHLIDTALPICSYALKPNESVVWKFYAGKSERDMPGELSILSDTIIGKKVYKRTRLINRKGNHELVFFLDCKAPKSIFHSGPPREEMYPDCKVVRSELRGDLNSRLTSVVEISVLAESLTSEEKNIFNQWGKNATEIKQPILTLEDVRKRYPPPSQ